MMEKGVKRKHEKICSFWIRLSLAFGTSWTRSLLGSGRETPSKRIFFFNSFPLSSAGACLLAPFWSLPFCFFLLFLACFPPSGLRACWLARFWLSLACAVLSGSFLAVCGSYLLGWASLAVTCLRCLAVACLLCPVWLVSVAVCGSYLLGWASLLLLPGGLSDVDFPTTHSGFQHECLAKSKVARFFRYILVSSTNHFTLWVRRKCCGLSIASKLKIKPWNPHGNHHFSTSRRFPWTSPWVFSGCNSLKQNRCPASRARHRWRRRVWGSVRIIPIRWFWGWFHHISPTRSEKNWSFLLIGWRFGTWMDDFFLLGME